MKKKIFMTTCRHTNGNTLTSTDFYKIQISKNLGGNTGCCCCVDWVLSRVDRGRESGRGRVAGMADITLSEAEKRYIVDGVKVNHT